MRCRSGSVLWAGRICDPGHAVQSLWVPLQDLVKCRRGGFAKVNNAPDARKKTLAREDNSGTKPSRNSVPGVSSP